MRIIAIEEKDISTLLDKLELDKLQLKETMAEKHSHVINDMHRRFHYEIVRFFQEQGADCRRN